MHVRLLGAYVEKLLNVNKCLSLIKRNCSEKNILWVLSDFH